jgi:hypothetical protein
MSLYRRRRVLNRIGTLAGNTIALGAQLSREHRYNKDWLQKHFSNMECHIRERERWAITPIQRTLFELRQDFKELLPIYLTRDYGEFKWDEGAVNKESSSANWRQKISIATRQTLALLIPLLIIGFLYKRPDQLLPGIGVPVATLVCIIWFLFAVDAVFKLGVVANLIESAKVVKEFIKS